MIGQHDKGGQVVAQRAQAITDPGPHPGEARQVEPRGLQQRGLGVHAGFADKIVDEGHVIGAGTERRHGFTEHLAGLAIGREIPDRLFPGAQSVLKRFHGFSEIRGLTVMLDERRFVIEEIDVRGGSAHEELHDPLGFGCGDRGAMQRRRGFEGTESERAESLADRGQHLTTRHHRSMEVGFCIHGLVDKSELVKIEQDPAGVFQALGFRISNQGPRLPLESVRGTKPG